MTATSSPLAALADPSLLKTDALINGEWMAGSARFDVTDPATGARLADVAQLGPPEAQAAIAAAHAAWRRLARQDRQGTQPHPAPLVRAALAHAGGPRPC